VTKADLEVLDQETRVAVECCPRWKSWLGCRDGVDKSPL
jgi:hypothetical protein